MKSWKDHLELHLSAYEKVAAKEVNLAQKLDAESDLIEM